MTPADAAAMQSQLLQDYRNTFGGETGRRVLADILRRGGLMQSSCSTDPGAMAFQEGKRRLGLEIVETINRDPAALVATITSGETAPLFHDQTGEP